jgi:hypothetical protein
VIFEGKVISARILFEAQKQFFLLPVGAFHHSTKSLQIYFFIKKNRQIEEPVVWILSGYQGVVRDPSDSKVGLITSGREGFEHSINRVG